MFIIAMALIGTTIFVAPQSSTDPATSVPILPPWHEEAEKGPSSPAHLTGKEGSGSLLVKIEIAGGSSMEQSNRHHQNNGNRLRVVPSPAGGNN